MNKRPKILIVDDVDANRIILDEILHDIYDVELAKDGVEAVSKLINAIDKPHLVLLDIMMPGLDGFQVMEHMQTMPDLANIPVILITAADAEIKGLALGAVDYIPKPFEPDIIRLRVSHQVRLVEYRNNMESMVKEKTTELLDTKQLFLNAMAQLIEHRSLESGDHVIRTRELAKILTQNLLKHGVYADEIAALDRDLFLRAVPLHDIGKISVPDHILLKPGKLEPNEFDLMKTHTTTGAQIIRSLMVNDKDHYLNYCHDICRYHHERWNGTGYPDRLAGPDIPLMARIVSVIDVYDALVSERCYKKAISHEKAIQIIKEGAETQFDPEIVKIVLIEHNDFTALYKN